MCCLFFAFMSFQVKRWIPAFPQLPDEDFRRFQGAVAREQLERQQNQQQYQLVFKQSRPNAEALTSAMNHLSMTVQENGSCQFALHWSACGKLLKFKPLDCVLNSCGVHLLVSKPDVRDHLSSGLYNFPQKPFPLIECFAAVGLRLTDRIEANEDARL